MASTTTRLALTAALTALANASTSRRQEAECTRGFLEEAAASYIAAQEAGDASTLAASSDVVYVENGASADLTSGMLSIPVVIDWSRCIHDSVECASFCEWVVTDPSHPYVGGSQIRYDAASGEIVDMETMVTDEGDWLFDAEGTLEWATQETWDEIPEDERDSREVIKAAGDAYCDIFSDKSVEVPWGEPCSRLEGGMYTGSGSETDRCDVGIPDNVELTDRRYVIDEVLGAVDIMLRFEGLPDSHEFRVEKGKLRYVHTITVMD